MPLSKPLRVGVLASSMIRMKLWDESGQERKDKINTYRAEIEDKIKKCGFTPIFPSDSIDPPVAGCGWSNTAEERARHMINALNNPEIDAIMQIDGGESAIEVIHLLDQYDKDWQATERKIKDIYKKKHDGAEPPEGYFLPRLAKEHYTDSEGRERGLPKRGIPHCGFSDGSGTNNFLGQRGIVRPYYANLPGGPLEDMQNITQFLSGEVEESSYSGLTPLNDKKVPEGDLKVYATVLGWLSSSCGTPFQFHLEEPSILAVESIEPTENIGRMLLQAQESGMLDNVRAIVMGRIGRAETIDPKAVNSETCPSLVKFLDETDIPFLYTGKDDTFGHGAGGVPKSFANFAGAKLSPQEHGLYSLTVKGEASQESLDRYYNHKSKTLAARIPAVDAPADDKALVIDWKHLRFTNGTSEQADGRGKHCVICADKIVDFAHLALIEGLFSGSLAGAKSFTFALPPKNDEITDPGKALQILIGTLDPFEQNKENPNQFTISNFPEEKWILLPLANMGIKVADHRAIPNKDQPDLKTVTITFADGETQKILNHLQQYGPEVIFSRMLEDAGDRYLGDTPLNIIHDANISQHKGISYEFLPEALRRKPQTPQEKAMAQSLKDFTPPNIGITGGKDAQDPGKPDASPGCRNSPERTP